MCESGWLSARSSTARCARAAGTRAVRLAQRQGGDPIRQLLRAQSGRGQQQQRMRQSPAASASRMRCCAPCSHGSESALRKSMTCAAVASSDSRGDLVGRLAGVDHDDAAGLRRRAREIGRRAPARRTPRARFRSDRGALKAGARIALPCALQCLRHRRVQQHGQIGPPRSLHHESPAAGCPPPPSRRPPP